MASPYDMVELTAVKPDGTQVTLRFTQKGTVELVDAFRMIAKFFNHTDITIEKSGKKLSGDE